MAGFKYRIVYVEQRTVRGELGWFAILFPFEPEPIDEYLNRSGCDGWELVSTIPDKFKDQPGGGHALVSYKIFLKNVKQQLEMDIDDN